MTPAPPGRRRLTDAEIELWLTVAKTVAPRAGAQLPPRPVPPAPTPPAKTPEPAAPLPVLPSYSPKLQASRPVRPPLAPFEKRYRQKVARGRIEVDGAIDLHGLTQPQAHVALMGYLRSASAEGARLVLVVTGKGRPRVGGGEDLGVLRRAVPTWLGSEDLRSIVMGFEEAALPHGGLGALYVRLRRRDR